MFSVIARLFVLLIAILSIFCPLVMMVQDAMVGTAIISPSRFLSLFMGAIGLAWVARWHEGEDD